MLTKFTFPHFLTVTFALAMAFLFSGCASDEGGNGDNGDSKDDKNVYCVNNYQEFQDWNYEAVTSYDLKHGSAAANIRFSCSRLPYGYYRALISTQDKYLNMEYALFTLDPDFNIVAYVTPSTYYVVSRSGAGDYVLRDAREFSGDLPEPSNPGDKKTLSLYSRAEGSYHKAVAQALVDFQPVAHPHSAIDFVDWPSVLRRIAADDTKPGDEVLSSGNYAVEALAPYEIEKRINEELADVRKVSTKDIMPLLGGVETANGKFIVHISCQEPVGATDADFDNMYCGLVLYDRYGTNPILRYWLAPKPVSRYECTIEYDQIPDADSYWAYPYIINGDNVQSASPLILNSDMALINETQYDISVLEDNAITIASVSSTLVSDPGSPGMKFIRVTGHARCDCDVDNGGQWFLGAAYLDDDYLLYGPKSPSSLYEFAGSDGPFNVREKDFDFLIPVDENRLIHDDANLEVHANLMIFIGDGGHGYGDYAIVRWSSKTAE